MQNYLLANQSSTEAKTILSSKLYKYSLTMVCVDTVWKNMQDFPSTAQAH